jgi:hypothetical protein
LVNVMTLTRSSVRTAITASRMRGKRLSIRTKPSHPANSSDSCGFLRQGIKILLIQSRKSLPVTYDFDRSDKTKSTPRRTPRLIGLLRRGSASGDITI